MHKSQEYFDRTVEQFRALQSSDLSQEAKEIREAFYNLSQQTYHHVHCSKPDLCSFPSVKPDWTKILEHAYGN